MHSLQLEALKYVLLCNTDILYLFAGVLYTYSWEVIR